MFGKQRCYLCGGKLENGRCTACGLDNAKNVQKKYRTPDTSIVNDSLRAGMQASESDRADEPGCVQRKDG